MAADVAEQFLHSAGGLYDAPTAKAWHDQVLSVGHSVPADAAFQALRGRDTDPTALMRRFGLAPARSARGEGTTGTL
jgi:peptidyl-dipeptidase Dcp